MSKNFPTTEPNAALGSRLTAEPVTPAKATTPEPPTSKQEKTPYYEVMQSDDDDHHYTVVRSKLTDMVIVGADQMTDGWEPTEKKRKFKSYTLVAAGTASEKQLGTLPYRVDGVLDSSEAKQVLYAEKGIGLPAKFPVKVTLNQ